MPPYKSALAVGRRVRVQSRPMLERFKADWKYHHPLSDEQLGFADVDTDVVDVSYYHGGDPLYQLRGIPGLWHEPCLTNPPSRYLVFPDRVTVHTRLHGDTAGIDFAIAYSIRTFARVKNDYRLGTFFSDDTGVLVLTRRQLELSAQANLSTGLMDFASVADGFPLVEIQHLSADDIQRAITSRTTVWTNELDGERELYGSMAQLLASYRRVGNAHLAPPTVTCLRDEWDGTRPTVIYDYPVVRARRK
jgi:hypothetical protein